MAGLVKVSEAVNLALHACLLLARSEGELVRTQDLSDRLGASKAHLVKVLQQLSRAGLLVSVRGPQGGTRLAHPASSMTLLSVYEAVDGPLLDTECLLASPICDDGECCLMGGLLRQVNEALRQRLSQTTLASACGGGAPVTAPPSRECE